MNNEQERDLDIYEVFRLYSIMEVIRLCFYRVGILTEPTISPIGNDLMATNPVFALNAL